KPAGAFFGEGAALLGGGGTGFAAGADRKVTMPRADVEHSAGLKGFERRRPDREGVEVFRPNQVGSNVEHAGCFRFAGMVRRVFDDLANFGRDDAAGVSQAEERAFAGTVPADVFADRRLECVGVSA